MSPIISGLIYPEAELSHLLYRELRVLLDPRAVCSDTVNHLIDLDVLKQYLQSLPGQPCQIHLASPPKKSVELDTEYEIVQRHGGEILSVEATTLSQVAEVFKKYPKEHPEIVALASIASVWDADIIITTQFPQELDFQDLSKKLFMSFEDWMTAKKSCEVFVRGHDVPWSFHYPVWGIPWTPFYPAAEPSAELMELYRSARETGIDAETMELMRSLAFNRHSSLCYTRDKLLFYVQQKRAAKRHRLRLQDFAFETGYHLNHYYLLLWAGLDQICWIVNYVFKLGFTRKDFRKVGVLNPHFLEVLETNTPPLLEIFQDPEFVKWVKMPRGARHFVAHEGLARAASLFVRPKEEPSDEELDQEIEKSEEWQTLKEECRTLGMEVPTEILETFRSTHRLDARLRGYKEMPELIMQIEIDGKQVLIYPLLNTE